MTRSTALVSPTNAAILGVAVALASAVIWFPVPTAVSVGIALLILICVRTSSPALVFPFWVLSLTLAAYSAFGRAFARIGVGPVYIGDAVLVLLLFTAIPRLRWHIFYRSAPSVFLLFFAIWGVIRTAPFVSVYKWDSLRDAVIWGYASFAITVTVLLSRETSLEKVIRQYRLLSYFLAVWFLLVGVAQILRPSFLPLEHAGEAFLIKPGDVCVHLAGVGAFWLLGLHRDPSAPSHGLPVKNWWLWGAWLGAAVVFGSQNRGGLVSLVAAMALAVLFARKREWLRFAAVCILALTIWATFEWEADIGTARKISPEQIVMNLASIRGDSLPANEGTRQWRLQWWRKIRGYTLEGEYFWTGKGFGVNLADDDGFQTDPLNRSLRSPHNGHMTILARMGVPGLSLWLLLLASCGYGLWRFHRVAKRGGDRQRAAIAGWLLCYLVAFLINGAFDVYLEGPQGGIWFWSVFGLALSLLTNPTSKPGSVFRADASKPKI